MERHHVEEVEMLMPVMSPNLSPEQVSKERLRVRWLHLKSARKALRASPSPKTHRMWQRSLTVWKAEVKAQLGNA